MALTVARADRHVQEWSAKLAPFLVRSAWPHHLFHTCQMEVAAEIIKTGAITCRSQVGNLICDVANQGALWNNPEAHNYVRLYFRPRNSFHLKTEGIKSAGDPYRADPHMSIPVAFAFDFRRVMTLANSMFVPGNFARGNAAPHTGDDEFDNLPFDLIYHDAGISDAVRRTEIHNWRMSEVVVQNSLSLEHLSYVICRTPHDERTLRHALQGHGLPNVIVEQRGSIFMRRGMFIDEIYWADNIMRFTFHQPTDHIKPNYDIRVTCTDAGVSRTQQFKLAPGGWNFPTLTASSNAVWKIEIEGCLTYNAPAPSVSGLVSA